MVQPIPHMPPAAAQRRVYSYAHCELHLFETTRQAAAVPLQFNHLTIMCMMRGKKVIRMERAAPFVYLPGESLVVPAQRPMLVDYPDAGVCSPTQCTALIMEESFVQKHLDQLDAQYHTPESSHHWALPMDSCFFLYNPEITATINKIVRLSQEHTPMHELRVDLSLKELLVLIAQQQHLSQTQQGNAYIASFGRFAQVLQFIKQHLSEKISIAQLSRIACMSRTNFFKAFKSYLGLSPADYIVRERINLAKQLLHDPGMSIAETAYQSGFNNIPYFIRQFRKQEQLTPGSYRAALKSNNHCLPALLPLHSNS
ncbi:MAG TPA: helix-turn-helix domain-containing protein [Chitinophaga sp.]|uniref:AraC family transcriptional regulator n=1 Tax=Chitinophaga sp. TaxID=1869181 RepID=UPI002DB67391|nr:helix-turn-helix domain-containing protein [Chitinophaga sp.]HEU4553428.1 helix-turn-helix domain-containing protein [Chitinophaga sp.]